MKTSTTIPTPAERLTDHLEHCHRCRPPSLCGEAIALAQLAEAPR